MSIISFPRRIDAPRRITTPRREAPARHPRSTLPTSTTQVTRERAGTRQVSLVKPVVIVLVALAIGVVGMIENGARQVALYNLQTQLQNDQSNYAEQLSTFTSLSAPSVVATQASSLHLVEPLSVSQIPSTSLGATLPLPKFAGHAPVTPRTVR